MSMIFTLLRRSVMSLPCFLPLAPLSLTGPADAVRGCLPFSHAFFGLLISPDADGGLMMAILLSAVLLLLLVASLSKLASSFSSSLRSRLGRGMEDLALLCAFCAWTGWVSNLERHGWTRLGH